MHQFFCTFAHNYERFCACRTVSVHETDRYAAWGGGGGGGCGGAIQSVYSQLKVCTPPPPPNILNLGPPYPIFKSLPIPMVLTVMCASIFCTFAHNYERFCACRTVSVHETRTGMLPRVTRCFTPKPFPP